MKILFTLIVLVLCNFSLFSQDCSPYILSEQGASWETMTITKTSRKKQINYSRHIIDTSYIHNESKISKVLSFKISKEGQSIGDTMYYCIICNNDTTFIDYAYYDGIQTKDNSKIIINKTNNVQQELSMYKISLPNKLTVGSNLPDGRISYNQKVSGVNAYNLTYDITNRTVNSLETITTNLGKFDCISISQKTTTKVVGTLTKKNNPREDLFENDPNKGEWDFFSTNPDPNGVTEIDISGEDEGSITIYLSEGIGAVKTETFDKKGKLVSVETITKIN